MENNAASKTKPGLHFGFFASSQNLVLEIESLESELEALDEKLPIVKQCRNRLERVKEAARSPFRIVRQYYIFTSLQWINQQLFEVRPRQSCLENWYLLKERIVRLPKEERGNEWDDDDLKKIDQALAGDDFGGKEVELRAKLGAARRRYDEKVALSLWHIVQANASIVLLALILLLLLTQLYPQIQAGVEKKLPEILNVMLAGALGGTLSSIMMLLTARDFSGPPLVNRFIINSMRPVIGAAAGFFFFLSAGLILDVNKVNALGFYAFAITFGFSERLFLGSLERLAKTAEAKVFNESGRKP